MDKRKCKELYEMELGGNPNAVDVCLQVTKYSHRKPSFDQRAGLWFNQLFARNARVLETALHWNCVTTTTNYLARRRSKDFSNNLSGGQKISSEQIRHERAIVQFQINANDSIRFVTTSQHARANVHVEHLLPLDWTKRFTEELLKTAKALSAVLAPCQLAATANR